MLHMVLEGAYTAAKWFVEVVILKVILLNLGRVFLLLATFGRYPGRDVCRRTPGRIQCMGAAVLLIAWSGLAVYNNMRT